VIWLCCSYEEEEEECNISLFLLPALSCHFVSLLSVVGKTGANMLNILYLVGWICTDVSG